ncbi:MAG: hypothetical protein M1503_02390 [Thaumarchaeota archaeon]|nr:hypothetical protein [Nitrososphaerota archaeon]MCL5317101.1 hypothetical protein [Nitrososphaerota archaeon]
MSQRKSKLGKARRRRGISAALGALIFLLIAVSIIVSLAFIISEQGSYNLAVKKTSELVTMKGKEHLKAYTASSNTILISNDGSITSKIVGLLEADDSNGKLGLNQLSIMISPGQKYEYAYQVPSGGTNTKAGVLTSMGNVFWVDPNAPPDYPTSDFSLSVIPSLVTVQQGGTSSVSVTVASINGYSRPVSLSVSGTAEGVAYSFQPGSGTPTFQSILTLTVSTSSTPAGIYSATVFGDDGAGKVRSASFTLQVNSPLNQDFTLSVSPKTVTLQQGSAGSVSITLQPLNGYSGTVSLSASGFPPGAAYSFNPLSATPPFTSTLSINVGSTTSVGSYAVSILGSDGYLTHHDIFTLQVLAQPDFTVSVTPNVISLNAGTSGTASVTVQSLNGYSGSVILGLSGLPYGAYYSFNPSSGAPSFTSTLTINTGTANPGTYALTITGTGTSDYRIHTASFTLVIVSPFDFSTSVSPASGSVGQGGSISTAVTILQQSGSTTQLVSLSATGGPSGASYTFSPQSGYPVFTSTLNIAVPSDAPTGTYGITIMGSDGGLTRIATYSLTITALQDFSIALSSSSVSVQQGGSASNTATVTPVNGYSNLVSLSSSGAPSEVTISFSPSSGTPTFSSTISISASTSAASGTYPITVTGAGSDGKTHATSFTLQVLANYKLTVSVSPQTGSSSDFIYDTFTSDLGGWSYTGSSGYTLSRDSSTGQPAPSALISGDNYNTLIDGMRKTVDISTWTSGSLTLTFNWRATSSWAGSEVTNANLRIEDADTGQSLYVERLIGGGVYDTGWRSYSKDVSSYASGHARIRIVLYLYDSWGSNWGQMNRYDNVRLAGPGGGASSSSGTTNPSPGTYSYQSGQQVQVTALPYSGWVFGNWLLDGSNFGITNPTTVTMSQDHSLTAVFTQGSTTQDFTVSANPSSITVQTGSSGSATVTVSSIGGYSNTVSLSLSGLPSGASYMFNPSSSVPTYSSTLTISADSAATGIYLLTATGTGSDGKVRSTSITLTVAASLDFLVSVNPSSGSVQQGGSLQTTVTATLTGGSSQVVSLSASGLPDGATYSFSPSSGSPTFQSTLSITTSGSTPAGTYGITVTGTGGGLARTATYMLTVTQAPQPFDFSLSVDPSSGSAPQSGSTIQSTVTVALLAGSSSSGQTVSLSATSSGVPQGLDVSFDPVSGSPDFTSTMTLSVGADIIPTGTYTITITGTGGGLTHSTTYTLTITDVPDFTVSVSPSSLSISQGSSGSTTVTVTALNGYSNPVTLSASNLPAGVVVSSYSFTPQNGYPSYTSTLTLSISSTASPGTYSITITGTGSDGSSRSTALSLAIQETSNILTILVKDQFNSPVQGIQLTIDSTAYSTDANGQVVQPTAAGSHTVSVQSTYSPSTGIRYLYTQWSDGTTSNPRTVTISGSTTYTAQTKKQYYLTTEASPSNGGWVSPSSSWYDAGAGVSISAAAYSGYMFESWTGTGIGSYSGANNPASVTMNSALHETASFQQVSTITVKTLATYGSLSTAPLSGVAVTVGGSTIHTDAEGTATFTVSNGGTYQISLTDTSKTVATSAVDVRNFQFMWWEDLSTSNPRSITVNGPATYTAYYPIAWQQYTLKPSTYTLEVADPSNTDPLGNPVLRSVTLPYSNSYSNWLQGWEWQDQGWTDTNGAYFGAHDYATWGYSNPWTFKWSSTLTPATHVYPVNSLTASYTGSLSVNGVSSDSGQGLYFRYRDTYNDKGDTSPSPDWSNTRSFSGSLSASHVFSPNQVIAGDLLTSVFLWAEGSNFEMRYSQGYGWTTNNIVVTLQFSPTNP